MSEEKKNHVEVSGSDHSTVYVGRAAIGVSFFTASASTTTVPADAKHGRPEEVLLPADHQPAEQTYELRTVGYGGILGAHSY